MVELTRQKHEATSARAFRMRNRTKWVLGGFEGTFILTFILLHTAPAKELFRRLLTRSAPSVLGGELTLRRLDYRLWRGEIRFEQLHWIPQAKPHRFALDSTEVEVLFSPLPGVSIFLASPKLTVFQTEGPAQRVEQEPWMPTIYAWLDQVQVTEGDLHVSGASGDPWLRMSSIQLSVTSADGRYKSHIRSDEIELLSLGRQITVGTVEVDLQLDQHGLMLES